MLPTYNGRDIVILINGIPYDNGYTTAPLPRAVYPIDPFSFAPLLPEFETVPAMDIPWHSGRGWKQCLQREFVHQLIQRDRVPAAHSRPRRSHEPHQISFWTSFYDHRMRLAAAARSKPADRAAAPSGMCAHD